MRRPPDEPVPLAALPHPLHGLALRVPAAEEDAMNPIRKYLLRRRLRADIAVIERRTAQLEEVLRQRPERDPTLVRLLQEGYRLRQQAEELIHEQ